MRFSKEAPSRGYFTITLWFLAEHVNSRQFCEKMGFKLDSGSKIHKFGMPLEPVRYRKKLGHTEPLAALDSQSRATVVG